MIFSRIDKMKTSFQHELEQRIGRNLLRYQLVELRLKQALPLRRITLSPEGMAEMQKALTGLHRKTLGQLGKDLLEAIEFAPEGGRDAFIESVDKFVDARNWLVHHLLQNSGMLLTESAVQACIARLDADYAAAENVSKQVMTLHRFVLQALKIFVDEWVAAVPATATEMGKISMQTASRLSSMGDGAVSVHLEVPVIEILADAMNSLERTQKREDGWVIFNVIGNTIRRDFGSAPPRLLRIAQSVPGFEFDVREVRPGSGTTWMFRRLPQDAAQVVA